MQAARCRMPTAASRSGVSRTSQVGDPAADPPSRARSDRFRAKGSPGEHLATFRPKPRVPARAARSRTTNRTPVRCTMRGHAVENHPDRRGHPQIDPWKSRSPMWTNGPRAWMSMKSRKPPHLAVAFATQPLHLVVLALTTATHRRIVLEVTRPTETPNPAPANGTIRRSRGPARRSLGTETTTETRQLPRRDGHGGAPDGPSHDQRRRRARHEAAQVGGDRQSGAGTATAARQAPPAATPAPTARASTARIPTASPPRA